MEPCQVKRLVAGSTNPAKIDALRALLAPEVAVIASPDPGPPLIDEDGVTIAEVTDNKAKAWAEWLNANDVSSPVIVTDGGLTIPALATWNPTRTRRFAGENRTPPQLAQALLELASELEGEARQIGWTEVAAIVRPDGQSSIFTAESPPGLLARSIRPGDLSESDGFWVPAVWLCPEFGMKRLVDLTDEERSRRFDHWDRLGAALRCDLDSSCTDESR